MQHSLGVCKDLCVALPARTYVSTMLFVSCSHYVCQSVTSRIKLVINRPCGFLSVYTVFALMEYCIVASNIAFHATFVQDMGHLSLTFADLRRPMLLT